ncbi:unnamed protein product [Nyctereutes procyonoides]|uniref:(raccoon dog) hypothetical protein n=1 Tax=Nyctereutes procyonoides TaxID=34880 RepID=A0A811YZV5_NYCPR|nr:unnamed protein product [Nyctereutes procyonoides]
MLLWRSPCGHLLFPLTAHGLGMERSARTGLGAPGGVPPGSFDFLLLGMRIPFPTRLVQMSWSGFTEEAALLSESDLIQSRGTESLPGDCLIPVCMVDISTGTPNGMSQGATLCIGRGSSPSAQPSVSPLGSSSPPATQVPNLSSSLTVLSATLAVNPVVRSILKDRPRIWPPAPTLSAAAALPLPLPTRTWIIAVAFQVTALRACS